MRTFSIRIDDNIFAEIEAERKDKARTDFIREVIEGYFITKSSPELNLENKDDLRGEIENLRGQVKDLTRIMENEQKLRAQRQVMPSQEEITKKSWWRFWKK